MASEEKKGPPTSLDALFKSKAKKKPKPVNLNAVTERPAPVKPAPLPKQLAHSSGGTSDSAEQGWERALRRDQELLKACDLWIKEVEADGACLFRAFADQLNGDGGEAHAQFREQCVDFMRDHREDFEPFLEEDFSEYCKRMREPSTWGGHVEVQALARLAGVNAIIYRPAEAGGQPAGLLSTMVEIPTSDDSDARCVQLSFHPTHHAGQHYNSVRCVSDDGAGPAPAASLAELRRRTEEALRPKTPEPVEQAEAGAGKMKKKVFF